MYKIKNDAIKIKEGTSLIRVSFRNDDTEQTLLTSLD